jgi:hypothetical protein
LREKDQELQSQHHHLLCRFEEHETVSLDMLVTLAAPGDR